MNEARQNRQLLLQALASLSDPSTIGPMTGFYEGPWQDAEDPGDANLVLTAPPGGGKSTLTLLLTSPNPKAKAKPPGEDQPWTWWRRAGTRTGIREEARFLSVFRDFTGTIPEIRGLFEEDLNLAKASPAQLQSGIRKLSEHLTRTRQTAGLIYDEPASMQDLMAHRVRNLEELPGLRRLVLLQTGTQPELWPSRPMKWSLPALCAMAVKQMLNTDPVLRNFLVQPRDCDLHPGTPERPGEGFRLRGDPEGRSRDLLHRILPASMGGNIPGAWPALQWLVRQVQDAHGNALPRPFIQGIAKAAWNELTQLSKDPDPQMPGTRHPLISAGSLRIGIQRACEQHCDEIAETRPWVKALLKLRTAPRPLGPGHSIPAREVRSPDRLIRAGLARAIPRAARLHASHEDTKDYTDWIDFPPLIARGLGLHQD